MLNCLSLIEIGLRKKSEKQVAPRAGRGAQHRRAEGCGTAFRENYSEIKAAALSTVDTRAAALV